MRPALRSSTALVLALAFLAGPVSASCLHGADHEMPAAMDHETTSHEAPVSEHAPSEMPPCHDEPEAPAPDVPVAPAEGCASVCCAVEAAAETPAVIHQTDQALLVAVVTTRALAAPVEAPVPTPEASPPRPPGPLHVLLERYLI